MFYLKNYQLTLDTYNNSCYSLLQNKEWYCGVFSNANLYFLVPELLIYGLLAMNLLAIAKGSNLNENHTKETRLLYILLPYLVLRIFSFKESGNFLGEFLYKNYYYVGEYGFWVLLLGFIIFLSLEKEDFIVTEKKVKTIELEKGIALHQNKNKTILLIEEVFPSILDKVFYSGFKKNTHNTEGVRIPNVFSILEITKEKDEVYFVSLNLIDDLMASLSSFSRYDWTLGIQGYGSIEGLQEATWKSEQGKNGIVLHIIGDRIDLSELYTFPGLFDEVEEKHNPLDFTIGIDERGKNLVYDFALLPHMLVASETGGGKSVALTNMLVSFMKNKLSGDPIQFFIVDPKQVEFSIFEGLQGFKIETNIEKGLNIAKWLVAEMSKRYDLLKKMKVKNIKEYHSKGLPMDYIVFIVDEFADIMTQGGEVAREFEKSIIRLTQLSRAVGIHLVLATQNPIGEVITSNIKANMPSRLGLRTSDAIKSRTIIDSPHLADIRYKGEGYIRTGEGLTHMKVYYIDNDTELSEFIRYYKEKTGGISIIETEEEKESVALHQGLEDVLLNFELGIDNGKYLIDKLSYSYILTKKLIVEGGYKSRRELISTVSEYGISRNVLDSLIAEMRNEGVIIYNENEKINKVSDDVTEAYIEKLYAVIFKIIKR